MHRTANTSRFLIDSSLIRGLSDFRLETSQSGAIRRIILSLLAQSTNSRQAFVDLTNNLIRAAEYAYCLRNMDTVQEIGEILISLPLTSARQIGQFYQALTFKRRGKISEAQFLFEAVADKGPLSNRARAIQALGALHYDIGQSDEALRFQLEALRAASDKGAQSLLVTLQARFEISHIRSDLGDHQGALDLLETLSPIARILVKQNPFYFYLHNNELAVELGELGRISEAKAACEIAIASPYAQAYPEWAETAQDLDAKLISASRSVVALDRAPEAAASPDAQPRREAKTARAPALKWLEHEGEVSISITFALAVTPVMAQCATAERATEFLCYSSQPRAPPAVA
jgi:tetratricopeptide (TPR) repeat protein